MEAIYIRREGRLVYFVRSDKRAETYARSAKIAQQMLDMVQNFTGVEQTLLIR